MFNSRKIQPIIAEVNTIGISLPIIVGIATDVARNTVVERCFVSPVFFVEPF